MNRIMMVLAALAVTACSSPTALDDRWADPLTIEFAESLNIDLSQMNLTESGLYWQDLVVGTGLTAEVGNTLYVHFTGWLPDGTVFESSMPGPMVEFEQVGMGLYLKGWDEGLPGMRVGGIRKLVVPPDLAYGRHRRGLIPPLATLIFEVELFHVVK